MAWVLVFDADTEEEAVYSMEMHEEDEGVNVVLAFEDEAEAQRYARTLHDEPYDNDASVQALDVAALVITSREADFRVGVVFKGDLEEDKEGAKAAASRFITGADDVVESDKLTLSITMVPESAFEGHTADEFLDPAEDPIWVLVHDAGTADAQYFSMTLNGTSSIVCFKDEEAAARCSEALLSKGSAAASAQSMLLEELLDSLSDDDVDVCLVDEVVETMVEDDGEDSGGLMSGPGIVAADANDEILGTFPADGGAEGSSQTSATPLDVRSMLDRLYEGDGGDDGCVIDDGDAS